MDGWPGVLAVSVLGIGACGPGVGGDGGTDTEGTSSGPICDVGELGCACTVGGACDEGLECREGVCLPGEGATMGSSSDTDSGSGSPTSTPATSESSSATTDTGIPEGCGDDELEAPEECDDGNNASGDGCNADCTLGGQLVWEHDFDGPAANTDLGHRIAVDSEDNVIVAGVTFGPSNDNDGWVIKLDDDGQFQWDEFYDSEIGTSNDGLFGVAVGPGDEIIVGGYSWADSNTQDRFLRCYSADGVELWSITDPGIYDEGVFDVAVDPDGDVVAVGTGRDPMDATWLVWLAKFTIEGDNVWTESFPAINNAAAPALAVDSAGSIFYGSGDSYAVLHKFSPSAQEQWAYQSELGSWRVEGIATDPADDVFAAGGIGNPLHSRLARHLGDGSGSTWRSNGSAATARTQPYAAWPSTTRVAR